MDLSRAERHFMLWMHVGPFHYTLSLKEEPFNVLWKRNSRFSTIGSSPKVTSFSWRAENGRGFFSKTTNCSMKLKGKKQVFKRDYILVTCIINTLLFRIRSTAHSRCTCWIFGRLVPNITLELESFRECSDQKLGPGLGPAQLRHDKWWRKAQDTPKMSHECLIEFSPYTTTS